MKTNNNKGRIRFVIFGYSIICIVAVAAIIFDDKLLEELTTVREVLFDGSELGRNTLVPVRSVNFETYVDHHQRSRVSFQSDESMYQHNNTQAAYMQNMAGNISVNNQVFATVALVENNANYSTTKRLSKSDKRDLALNSVPKFLNGKKLSISSVTSSDGIQSADAVSDDEIIASQVMQKSTTDVGPSGDPEENMIPVGDGYWFLALMLLCYAWYKHSSKAEEKLISKAGL